MAQPQAPAMVEVSVADMLGFGHEYEYFVDLLRDRLGFDEENDDEFYRTLVTDYHAVGVARPDVIVFEVNFEIEDE